MRCDRAGIRLDFADLRTHRRRLLAGGPRARLPTRRHRLPGTAPPPLGRRGACRAVGQGPARTAWRARTVGHRCVGTRRRPRLGPRVHGPARLRARHPALAGRTQRPGRAPGRGLRNDGADAPVPRLRCADGPPRGHRTPPLGPSVEGDGDRTPDPPPAMRSSGGKRWRVTLSAMRPGSDAGTVERPMREIDPPAGAANVFRTDVEGSCGAAGDAPATRGGARRGAGAPSRRRNRAGGERAEPAGPAVPRRHAGCRATREAG